MKYSHWKANCSASTEVPSILLNLKFRYCVHKILQFVPIPCCVNPAHTLLSVPWSLSFLFPSSFPMKTLNAFHFSPMYAVCLTHLHDLTILIIQRILSAQWSCITFCNMLTLYGEELFLCPIPNLEDHPLLAVCDCLVSVFTMTPHVWKWSLTWGCNVPWWQRTHEPVDFVSICRSECKQTVLWSVNSPASQLFFFSCTWSKRVQLM